MLRSSLTQREFYRSPSSVAVIVGFHCDVVNCDLARRGVLHGESEFEFYRSASSVAVVVGFHCDVVSCDLARRGVRHGESEFEFYRSASSVAVVVGFHCDIVSCDLARRGEGRGELGRRPNRDIDTAECRVVDGSAGRRHSRERS